MLVNHCQGGRLDVFRHVPHAFPTPAFEALPHLRGRAILA